MGSLGPTEDDTMPIAIIGIGFRGPGDATNVENLWKMISEGRESWSEIPKHKWNHDAFYHPDPNRHGTYNVKGGHFIQQDVTQWDAPFFQMSAAEAIALDPQQRLLLECTYEAMENSGTTMSQFCGSKTSVFAGAFTTDYTDVLWRDPESTPMYQCTNSGQCRSNFANRISYFFDLQGQSVDIDTACSTSLVGLHLGCQSLRTGESKMSIVGGANVILSHEAWVTMSMMRFLSPDGRCYSFDERANGYARGEGVGVLLLKPLHDALRDGDTIRAVIRGTGSSQDGKTPGITMPNGIAQEELIRSVYARSGLNPLQTSYVECHGTGTQAGDPLETRAISRAFCSDRESSKPIRIGSVKTNVGHLEATSGIAGVIKSVLMLENKVFLPNRNFEKANPRIPLEEWKLKIPLSLEPWDGPLPRRASVNSFGYGGAIAHVILESAEDYLTLKGHTGHYRTTKSLIPPELQSNVEYCGDKLPSSVLTNGHLGNGHTNGSINGNAATNGAVNGHSNQSTNGKPGKPNIRDATTADTAHLLVLSSFDEFTGKQQVENLRHYLEKRSDNSDSRFLGDLTYTLNKRRTHHIWRTAIIARSTKDLAQTLAAGTPFKSSGTKKRRIGFVFTGQGAQWCGMGKELIYAYPLFRARLEKIGECLKAMGAPFDVVEELTKDPKKSDINRALYSQPLCTAIQIALVDLFASFGVKPSSVTGHSSGEICAAYAIGALSFEDAMRVAYFRGVSSTTLASQGVLKGSMMAVGLSKEETLPFLASLKQGKAGIACSNSPSSVTVSGDETAIDELYSVLEKEKAFARKLVVEVAYHSHHMAQVGEEYRSSIADIKVRTDVEGAFFSSVSGKRIDAAELGPSYWVANMLGEVKFSESFQKLCLESSPTKSQKRSPQSIIDDIIEIGPHSALAGPIKQIIQADEKLKAASISYHSPIVRNKNAVDTVLQVLGSLYTLGFSIDLSSVNLFVTEGTTDRSTIVDLPPYAWNHSNTYWHESRKSKAYRNRPFPRTDLLGALERESSPMEPRWSNHIRLSELPWVRDHVIQSNIVYPAAGYVVMAIEAAFQRATLRSVTSITGYNLREIVIGSALVIPETPGEVEVCVSLKSFTDSISSPSDLWDEFIVSSVTGEGRWTEHCRGLVSIQTQSKTTNDIDGESQRAASRDGLMEMILEYNNKCQKPIQIPRFYETIAKLGLQYGKTFANMTKARAGPSTCVGRIKVPDTAAVMPQQYQFPFVVHPATLDALFHTIFVALGAEDMKDPAVPVYVDELFVSSSITSSPGDELVSYTSVEKKDNRSISASLTVLGPDQASTSEPPLYIRGIKCTALEVAESEDSSSASKSRAYNLNWKPDLDMLSPEALHTILRATPVADQLKNRHKIEVAAFYLLKSIVEKSEAGALSVKTTYEQDLLAFMKNAVESTLRKNIGSLSEEWLFAEEGEQSLLLEEVKSQTPEGRILCETAAQLSRVLTGDLAPTSLVGEIDLSVFFGPSDLFIEATAVAKFIETLAFKRPQLSIVACGKLSGFLSLPILGTLSSTSPDVPCFSKFEYNDAEFDLSDLIKKKCPNWSDLVSRGEFDITAEISKKDPAFQSHDVVIVFQALGTKDLGKVLENAQKILKPGGRLILLEQPLKSLVSSTVLGFLPSTLPSQSSPHGGEAVLSEADWASMLSHKRYSQDFAISNPRDRTNYSAVFLKVLLEETAPSKYSPVLIVGNGVDLNISTQYLQQQLLALNVHFEAVSFEKAKPTPDQICIVLSEPRRHILNDPSESQWITLKEILLHSAGVLWVSQGATMSSADPDSNLISGIMRTVRSENGSIPLMTLDLNSDKRLDEIKTAEIIFSLFKRHFQAGGDIKDMEHEYAERDGVLMIPRLIEDKELVKFVSAVADEPEPKLEAFRQSGRPLSMHVGTPGLLDSIRFIDDDRFDEDLPSNWVQMEVKATGVNFKDVMTALGQITLKRLGWEASGVVTALGRDVTHLSIGDRVLSYGAGLFSTDYRGPSDRFHKIPDHLSFERAASIPVTYATAYYSCHYIARLQKGESVLVHAASGGLGQAIIELCQLIGVEVYATVGTADKKEFLMQHFKIPADHIFFSRDGSFAKGIKKITNGRGIDVIMNSLAGENLRLTWDCIAPWGRFVELGQRDITTNTRIEMKPLSKNTTFAGFLLDDLFEQRPMVASEVIANAIDLFSTGKIRGPAQIHTFSITDLEKALRTMQTGGHMGKLVAVNNPGDMVRVVPRDNRKTLLRPDVSYMLVGGLGGIGRATALWMLEHGAKNLILVNRSGLNSDEAKETVQDLKAKGALVAVYACDITDSAKFDGTVMQATKEMPPIKGVIQGAMILRDILFESMSLEDYKLVLKPKVQGTWNLHNSLPKDMDFFVMESSVSGIIGNATQSAYAAGNTFLDSFASYRIAQGLPASTIDLGAISDVGYLATNPELREAMQRQGFELTDRKGLMNLIHFAIKNPHRPGLASQSVTGLGTWNEGNSLDSLNRPLFAHFRSLTDLGSSDAEGSSSVGQLRKTLRTTKNLEDASEVICTALVEKIASRSGLGVEHINTGNPVSEYGIDSLVAVEVRNWISKEMSATIPILELLANIPITQLATSIAQRSRIVQVNETEKA